jgi:hypothetical protein
MMMAMCWGNVARVGTVTNLIQNTTGTLPPIAYCLLLIAYKQSLQLSVNNDKFTTQHLNNFALVKRAAAVTPRSH